MSTYVRINVTSDDGQTVLEFRRPSRVIEPAEVVNILDCALDRAEGRTDTYGDMDLNEASSDLAAKT